MMKTVVFLVVTLMSQLLFAQTKADTNPFDLIVYGEQENYFVSDNTLFIVSFDGRSIRKLLLEDGCKRLLPLNTQGLFVFESNSSVPFLGGSSRESVREIGDGSKSHRRCNGIVRDGDNIYVCTSWILGNYAESYFDNSKRPTKTVEIYSIDKLAIMFAQEVAIVKTKEVDLDRVDGDILHFDSGKPGQIRIVSHESNLESLKREIVISALQSDEITINRRIVTDFTMPVLELTPALEKP